MPDLDLTKLAINLRKYLINIGRNDLAILLKDVVINIQDQYRQDYENDEPYKVTVLTIQLPNRFIHLYDEKDDQTLKDAVYRLTAQSINTVTVLSLLDDTDEENWYEAKSPSLYAELDIRRNALSNAHPVFGTPPPLERVKSDVFVIMPFLDKLKPIYTHCIKPAMDELQLTVRRGDDFFSQHAIISEIWTAIRTCQLVVADCTERNANVFYELGMAHMIAKPVIMLTQSETDIPFDIKHMRHIVYQNQVGSEQKLKLELQNAVKQLLQLPDAGEIPDLEDIPF